MSTFGGIFDAGSALNAARHGLDVISENIANAATPGYTRRTVQQVTATSTAGVAHIQSGVVNQGGVQVLSDARMTDPVLTARARVEQSRNQLATTSAAQLSQIESVFPEPSDNGLSEQLNAFFNAWAGVANDPGSSAARSVVIHQGATVAATLNSMSNTLNDITTSTRQSLGFDVSAANSAATQLATLNGQIAVASATGADANGLLDQRDQLLTSLSTLVGGVATINANGSADVTVAGQSLVSGQTATAMTFDNVSTVTVGATAVTLTGGSGAAELSGLTTTIPSYQATLDTVANTLATTVNTAAVGGFDLAGNPGVAMFSGTGAANLTMAISNPSQVVASATPGGTLDGSVAQGLFDTSSLPGSAGDLYTQLVADVGSASAGAQQSAQVQGVVTTNVLALQTSVSGVNTDEEVSSMLAYQTAYSAASRVLTTLDSMLDTLINHTGLVGTV